MPPDLTPSALRKRFQFGTERALPDGTFQTAITDTSVPADELEIRRLLLVRDPGTSQIPPSETVEEGIGFVGGPGRAVYWTGSDQLFTLHSRAGTGAGLSDHDLITFARFVMKGDF